MPPLFECLDNCQHFFVMDFVIPFHQREGFRQESNGMPLSVFQILLRQDSPGSKIWAVCLHTVRSRVIWKHQNWIQGDSILKCIKGWLLLGSPFKCGVGFSQVEQRSSDVWESFYEPPIEVDEPQEWLDFLLLDWVGHSETPATLAGSNCERQPL